ncbi:phosphatase [Shewanella phage SppYZU05]|uniref:Appr_1_p processing domain-containing protein n=1 Tax=Shewanella phage SppYZU05 TaxID=1970795 RepID=A0A1W6JTJ3_9CAUD|nr:phosphatase [Shewanella phage SppYZU05]ARM70567.1 appr_1_p processing domain-containing protein [Shewanella phage SppYZU05]
MNYVGRPDVLAITTNGFVTSRGAGVMGMGIAKQMSDAYPELPSLLGRSLRENGNIVAPIHQIGNTTIVSFPVKPSSLVIESLDEVVSHARSKYAVGHRVPGFHCVADPDIIQASCMQLADFMVTHSKRHALIPIPGCGAGELSFNQNGVREICESNLPDNVWMMSYNKSDFLK